MEIEGYDTVIFTPTRPRDVFAAFIASLSARWPSARFSLGWGNGPFLERDRIAEPDLPAEKGEVFAVRDRAMEEHFAEQSYTPMIDGEGPIALLIRYRTGIVFRCDRLEEVQAADRRAGEVEPYLAWLCGGSLYEVTVITPSNPERDSFSRWVCQVAREACLAEGTRNEDRKIRVKTREAWRRLRTDRANSWRSFTYIGCCTGAGLRRRTSSGSFA